ncbi:MAG: tyrosine-type recombinase/integrase, partial [Henriciella sp.]|uniref:tyrosine-type recombinase/integrase n=1 Tax=Henriciella sp. TaxID=1968823 RepID=UPI003C7723D6
LKSRLKHAAGRGDPSRKQGRILSTLSLLDAATMLGDEARMWPEGSLFRATGLRDAAMVALLALLPMRRRALASLRLGESILVGDDRITVALSGALTKTGVPWEADVPPQSDPFLRAYLAEARPVLAARGRGKDTSLWLDRTGKRMSENYLGSRIGGATLRMTGVRVPPHFFRDSAATTLVRISPEAAKLISSVLGHKGPGTAERHYIHAQSIEAGRDYAALIASRKGRR